MVQLKHRDLPFRKSIEQIKWHSKDAVYDLKSCDRFVTHEMGHGNQVVY